MVELILSVLETRDIKILKKLQTVIVFKYIQIYSVALFKIPFHFGHHNVFAPI